MKWINLEIKMHKFLFIIYFSCVKGILNFISEGNHQFGQGVITYMNDQVSV